MASFRLIPISRYHRLQQTISFIGSIRYKWLSGKVFFSYLLLFLLIFFLFFIIFKKHLYLKKINKSILRCFFLWLLFLILFSRLFSIGFLRYRMLKDPMYRLDLILAIQTIRSIILVIANILVLLRKATPFVQRMFLNLYLFNCLIVLLIILRYK